MYTIYTDDPWRMPEEERKEMVRSYVACCEPESVPEYITEPEDMEDALGPEIWDALEWWYMDTLENIRENAPEVPGIIVVMGSLHLWNGHRYGYKVLGRDPGEIFNPDDYGLWTWNVENSGQVTAIHGHHDGTNCYDYYWVPDETMEALNLDGDDLDDLLYDGKTWDGREIDPWSLMEPFTGEMLGSIG